MFGVRGIGVSVEFNGVDGLDLFCFVFDFIDVFHDFNFVWDCYVDAVVGI